MTDALLEEKKQLEDEMSIVVEMTQSIVEENARVAQDQEEYQKRYNALVERYDKAKARYDEVTAAISAKEAQSERLKSFIQTLKTQDGAIKEFDSALWGSMVEYITVGKRKKSRSHSATERRYKYNRIPSAKRHPAFSRMFFAIWVEKFIKMWYNKIEKANQNFTDGNGSCVT